MWTSSPPILISPFLVLIIETVIKAVLKMKRERESEGWFFDLWVVNKVDFNERVGVRWKEEWIVWYLEERRGPFPIIQLVRRDVLKQRLTWRCILKKWNRKRYGHRIEWAGEPRRKRERERVKAFSLHLCTYNEKRVNGCCSFFHKKPPFFWSRTSLYQHGIHFVKNNEYWSSIFKVQEFKRWKIRRIIEREGRKS